MHNPSVLSPLQCSWSSTGISSAFFHPLSTGLKIVIIFLCANSPPLPLPGFKPLKKGPGAVRNGKRIRSFSPPVQQLRPATSSQGPELSGGFTWWEGRLGATRTSQASHPLPRGLLGCRPERKTHSPGSRTGPSWWDESEDARVQPLINAPTQQCSETWNLVIKNYDFRK